MNNEEEIFVFLCVTKEFVYFIAAVMNVKLQHSAKEVFQEYKALRQYVADIYSIQPLLLFNKHCDLKTTSFFLNIIYI